MPPLDRRRFLVAAATVPFAPSLLGKTQRPCDTATPRATLVPAGEPGPPLVVSGQVVQADGATPAAGVILYVYQTDLTGEYTRFLGRTPRLRGFLRTDAQGRYEYRTIKPAPYPGGSAAAHIHTQMWGKGVPPQWGSTLEFEDDPLVPERDRKSSREAGRFAWVRPLTRGEGGVLQATHDLRLKTTGDDFEGNTRHGLEACGLA